MNSHSPANSAALRYVLSGGDDYELVFTAAPQHRAHVEAAGTRKGTPVTRIGRIVETAGVKVKAADGSVLHGPWASFDHFAT